jgi:hypothetical protein
MSSNVAEIARGEREMEEVVASRYRSFQATSPDTAVEIVPTDPIEADRFDAMRADGVIRGAEGGFYLDEAALTRLRKARKGWLYGGAGVAAVLGVIAGVVLGRRGR